MEENEAPVYIPIDATLSFDDGKTEAYPLDLPAGYPVDTTGWDNAGDVFSKEITNDIGTFLLSWDGATLTCAPKEAVLVEENLSSTLDIPLLGPGSAKAYTTLSLEILDARPVVHFAHTEGSPDMQSGTVLSGVWNYDLGVDQGPAGDGVLRMTVSVGGADMFLEGESLPLDNSPIALGGYGILRMFSNGDGTGTFDFESFPNQNSLFTLGLSVVDADGDPASDGFAVTIGKPAISLSIFDDSLQEASLPAGTRPLPAGVPVQARLNLQNHTVVTGAEDGWSTRGDIYELAVPGGALTYDPAEEALYFELLSPLPHSGNDMSAVDLGNVLFRIMDHTVGAVGCDVPINIQVRDDAPVFAVDNDFILLDSAWGFAADGEFALRPGADVDISSGELRLMVSHTYVLAHMPPQPGTAFPVSIRLDGTETARDTDMGRITLSYDAATGTLRYSEHHPARRHAALPTESDFRRRNRRREHPPAERDHEPGNG